MNKMIRRAGGAMLATVLFAASIPAATGAQETENAGAMGRYLEEEISLVDGWYQILDLKVQTDGQVKALLSAEEETLIMNSSDNGATWTEDRTLPQEMQSTDTTFLYQAVLSPVGEVFGLYAQTQEDGNVDYIYRQCGPDGNVTEVELSFLEGEDFKMLMNFSYAAPGQVAGIKSTSEQIYLFDDKTGEVIRTLNENENNLFIWEPAGSELYGCNFDDLFIYNLETGEETTDQVLRDAILENPDYVEVQTSNKPLLFAADENDETLYYCTRSGLYSHAKGGAVIEQLIDGNLTSLGDPTFGMNRMQKMADGSILIAGQDNSNGNGRLMRYVYDPDVPTVPEKELSVYMLRDNSEVRRVASAFRKSHPEYYIDLQVGMSGEDGATTSDALRTLNTDIMAGEGPDVLIMDGMPIDSYGEKGMLTDLGPALAELGETDGFYENILKAWERDGALYTVPSRFRVPVLTSTQEILSQIGDFTSLADTLEQLRGEDSQTGYMIPTADLYWTLKRFYSPYSPNFMGEDGGMNEEAVREFVTQSKRIYDLDEHTEEKSAGWDFVSNINLSYRMDGVTMDMVYFLEDNTKAGLGTVDCLMDQLFALGIHEKKGLTQEIPEFSQGKVFVPDTLVGVSSRSSCPEDAQEFVKFMLSKEVQAEGVDGGFPVNRAVGQLSSLP